MSTMLRASVGLALRRQATAPRFSHNTITGSRNMCSGGANETKRINTPEVVFVTIAAISMATYCYAVRGKTLLGYTHEEPGNEQDEVDFTKVY